MSVSLRISKKIRKHIRASAEEAVATLRLRGEAAQALAFMRKAVIELDQHAACSPNDDWAEGILALAPDWLRTNSTEKEND